MNNEAIALLVRELKSNGVGELRDDIVSRAIYSTDASDYRKVPAAVFLPKSRGDLSSALTLARPKNVGIIPRGGGSSLSGQVVGEGLVTDCSKYLNRILDFNPEEKWVWAEAGVNLDSLNAFLAPYGLMVGPDPSSSAVATLGGMIGNNSTGAHSIKYGMIADHVVAAEVILADGSCVLLENKSSDEVIALASKNTAEGRLYSEIPQILKRYRKQIETRYPNTWRNVAGYGLNRLLGPFLQDGSLNLSRLIAGSEGTLAFITKVKLALVAKPETTRLMILHFDELAKALELVPALSKHPVSAVELMNSFIMKIARDHPLYASQLAKFVQGRPEAILIVEFANQTEEKVARQAQDLEKSLLSSGYSARIFHCVTPEEINRVWSVRKSLLGLILSRPKGAPRIFIIDDPTVPVNEMTDFTREVIEAGNKFGLSINFDGHASAGCLHMSMELDLRKHEDIEILKQLSAKVVDLSIAHHGTSTGEHGDGLARSHFIEKVYGSALKLAFKEVKSVFDPSGCLNPGKIVNSPKPWDTTWFRYAPGYSRPYAPQHTFFDYGPYDSYAGLVEMCNGTGTCRSRESGTMCPSYRVTNEEQHTTRGRANALRAALSGELGLQGLSDPKLYPTLDLCVACKACRNECPTRVDMAKLKHEFLAHYQAKHGVPVRSRLFANLERTDKLARLAPGLTNRVYQNRTFRKLLDRTVGIDQRRPLPSLSGSTFQSWFHARKSKDRRAHKPVILWDDCHLSQHQPQLGKAAVKVLEASGFKVHLIRKRRCCGRPMISKGLLSQARANARHNIALLSPWAEKGVPIIGVEPSCIACFQDEYPDLLGTPKARMVAANTFFVERFITTLAREEKLDLRFNKTVSSRKIIVHTHCYQKAFGTSSDVLDMLRLIPGANVEEIPSGCCGMAGSFGYEKEHYDISMAMGEETLFPHVRKAADDTIIAAAGTSCREQIKAGSHRRAKHPIEILSAMLQIPDSS